MFQSFSNEKQILNDQSTPCLLCLASGRVYSDRISFSAGDPAAADPQAADATVPGGLAEDMGPSTGPPAETGAPGHPAVVDATTSVSVDALPFTLETLLNNAGFDARVIAVTDAPMMPSATEAEASPVAVS